jgi:hypothetical protein
LATYRRTKILVSTELLWILQVFNRQKTKLPHGDIKGGGSSNPRTPAQPGDITGRRSQLLFDLATASDTAVNNAIFDTLDRKEFLDESL